MEDECSAEEIRRAYRRLSLRWHPDKNPERRQEAEERFKEIAEAYSVLSDEEARAMYDHERSGRGRGFHSGRRGVDPFDIFEAFFGREDPFQNSGGFFTDDFSTFMGGGFGGSSRSSARSPFGAMDAMMGQMFGDPFAAATARAEGIGGSSSSFASSFGGGGFSSFSSSSSSSSFGGGGQQISQSSSTVIENGQRVTKVTKTVRRADGSVETSTEEHVDQLDPNHSGGFGSRFLQF